MGGAYILPLTVRWPSSRNGTSNNFRSWCCLRRCQKEHWPCRHQPTRILDNTESKSGTKVTMQEAYWVTLSSHHKLLNAIGNIIDFHSIHTLRFVNYAKDVRTCSLVDDRRHIVYGHWVKQSRAWENHCVSSNDRHPVRKRSTAWFAMPWTRFVGVWSTYIYDPLTISLEFHGA